MIQFKLPFVCTFLATALIGTAQVGIGTNSPSSSAQLEVKSTSKGFLPPRVILTGTSDVTTIASPATGLLVYNTATAGSSPANVTPGFYYYDGSKWQRIINQQPDATISFNQNTPTTGGVVFTPNIQNSTDYIYVSSTNNSQWTYNGSAYVTYTPPASTPWMLSGGTTDAGSNKSDAVYRTGSVGIGSSTTPNASAQLDVNSTTKGFLPPRMTSTQRGAITAPATGLVVYQTDGASGLYQYNGTTWKQFAPVEVDNTYKLVSTGVASVIATSQDIAASGIVTLTNSSITVTVPAGFTDVRVILQWNVWGDVVATTNAAGSIRYQIVQTGQSSATYSSVMMASWNALNGTASWASPPQAVTRYSAPVSYILTNPAAGTYTFTLEMNREAEAGTITYLKNWGVSGTGQVFVR